MISLVLGTPWSLWTSLLEDTPLNKLNYVSQREALTAVRTFILPYHDIHII